MIGGDTRKDRSKGEQGPSPGAADRSQTRIEDVSRERLQAILDDPKSRPQDAIAAYRALNDPNINRAAKEDEESHAMAILFRGLRMDWLDIIIDTKPRNLAETVEVLVDARYAEKNPSTAA